MLFNAKATIFSETEWIDLAFERIVQNILKFR